MSCGVGHRQSSDSTLLWLWCRPVPTALTGPLGWEPPHATGVALKRQKKKKDTVGSFHNPTEGQTNVSTYILRTGRTFGTRLFDGLIARNNFI